MESFKSSIFKDKALKALSGKWKPSVIVSLVTMLIIGGSIAFQHVSVLLYYAVFWLFGSIVSIGCAYVFLDLYRDKKEPRVADLFTPFRQYGRIVTCYIQVLMFTILWSLLLFVPGIIKGLSYSMSYFILKDRPYHQTINIPSPYQKMFDQSLAQKIHLQPVLLIINFL